MKTACNTIIYITLFMYGFFVYLTIETLWNWSQRHIAMGFVGGIALICLGGINYWIPWKMAFWKQCLIGAGVITAIEFTAGLLLNIILGLDIWDYSGYPFNVMGQVCLMYTLLWIPLSAFGIWLYDFLRWKIFGELKPKYSLIKNLEAAHEGY